MSLPLVEIGQCCEVVNGSTPSRSKPEYWGGDIDWFTPKDLSGLETKYVYGAPEKITEEGYKSCSTKLIPIGSLLYTSRAPIGHLAINKKEVCTNQGFKTLIPKENVNVEFLYYVLKKYTPNLKDLGNGATFKELSKSIISSFKIPLPPLETQKKIAAILDAADSYKQKTKALIEKYDQLTQSLFLDMFGDPVTNPKGWEVFEFSNVMEIRNGKNQKAVENEKGKYPIYGSGGIMSYADDYISEANSVIIGRKGNINKPILVKEKYWHVDTAFGLNPIISKLTHDYLFWFCVRYNFEQHNKTVTIPSLTKETLLRIKIPTPPIELQNQFAERVQAIEAQKALAQKSLKKSEELFNSLLQKAFKGELVS